MLWHNRKHEFVSPVRFRDRPVANHVNSTTILFSFQEWPLGQCKRIVLRTLYWHFKVRQNSPQIWASALSGHFPWFLVCSIRNKTSGEHKDPGTLVIHMVQSVRIRGRPCQNTWWFFLALQKNKSIRMYIWSPWRKPVFLWYIYLYSTR